jgi:hypothetical protein
MEYMSKIKLRNLVAGMVVTTKKDPEHLVVLHTYTSMRPGSYEPRQIPKVVFSDGRLVEHDSALKTREPIYVFMGWLYEEQFKDQRQGMCEEMVRKSVRNSPNGIPQTDLDKAGEKRLEARELLRRSNELRQEARLLEGSV